MPYRNPHDPRRRASCARHYYRNKQQYLDRNKARLFMLKRIMAKHKDKPCMDCKATFRAVAMDFDHRDPATKLHTPALLPRKGNLGFMLAELEKCDVVCSNCHRVREETRRNARTAAARALLAGGGADTRVAGE